MKFGINTTHIALKMEISIQHSRYQISLLPMLLLESIKYNVLAFIMRNTSCELGHMIFTGSCEPILLVLVSVF